MREIRQDLPVFLRRVRDGESLTVTDHGAPVALLTPVPAAGDDPLGDVIAAGRVLPGVRRGNYDDRLLQAGRSAGLRIKRPAP